MEQIAILDFNTNSVHVYDITNDTDINEEYIKHLGFNPDSVIYMFGEIITVIKHKETLKPLNK